MTAAKVLPADLIDILLSDYKKSEDLIGENGLLKQLTKALVELALDAEMEAHLGHAKNEAVNNPAGNTRNDQSSKSLKGEFGELPIEIPRVTAMAVLSRSLSPNTRPAGMVSTRISCRCMPVA